MATRAHNAFGFGRRATMTAAELHRQKESDAKALCSSGKFRQADKLARQPVSRYARQKGVKVANSASRPSRRSNTSLDQVEARQARAVDFLRRVAGNEQADKLAAEPVRSYARRKGIRIDQNPRKRNEEWMGPVSAEDLDFMRIELWNYDVFRDLFPAGTPGDWNETKKLLRQAMDFVEAGGKAYVLYDSEGWRVKLEKGNPPRRKRRRNSSETDAELAEAGAAFEEFQGREPDGVLDVETEMTARPVLSKLGDLVSLTVLTLDGGKKKISFSEEDAVIACQNPSGDQIYFTGGNQDVRALLEDLGVDASKDLVELGQCVEIEYFTRKKLDNFQAVRYYHTFGEETGVVPTLAFDQLNCHLELVGGAYYIRPEGIRN